MDFSNFLLMQHEVALVAVFLILFFADILGGKDSEWFYPFATIMFVALTVFGFVPKSFSSLSVNPSPSES